MAIWAHLTEPGISRERGRRGRRRGPGRGAALTSFHSLLPVPCTKRMTTVERGAEPCHAAPCPHPEVPPLPPTWVGLGEGVHVQQVPGGTELRVSDRAHPTRRASPACPPCAGSRGMAPLRTAARQAGRGGTVGRRGAASPALTVIERDREPIYSTKPSPVPPAAANGERRSEEKADA